MNRFLVVVVVVSLWGAWNWWHNDREERVPPGVVAAAAPVQANLDTPPRFEVDGYTLFGRARYEIEARILRKAIYRLDDGAALAPVDLGVGWGPMSDTTVVDQLEFSQMGRFFYWRPRDWRSFPLSPAETATHAAQIHAIPASADIDARLRRLRPGQVVHLAGYLVDVRGSDGFVWNTSLRRDDTGDGACEIMWIEAVTVQ